MGTPVAKVAPPGKELASFDGEAIEPFLVSGGLGYYPAIFDEGTVSPAADGVQLVCAVYVPKGRVGFLKQLRVAPFMPPSLADPWTTLGASGNGWSYRAYDSQNIYQQDDAIVRPAGTNGVWTTPMGWENYWNAIESEPPPRWEWHLRLVQGDISDASVRGPANIGSFDPNNYLTWYLQPNIPVPLAGYPLDIPGSAPGPRWTAQRMQVLQGDELDTHVLVPENTSLCLFTKWSQRLFQPRARDANGVLMYGNPVYPLGPSFGQLHGYMQVNGQPAGNQNAKFGWGG